MNRAEDFKSIHSTQRRKKKRYHEMDKLAGCWSALESKGFQKRTKLFEAIDKELWS